MGKKQKMIVCRNCDTAIPAKAKECPYCGAKNKKPFYKRKWFILLVAIILLNLIQSNGVRRRNVKSNNKVSTSQSSLETLPRTSDNKVGATTEPKKTMTEPTEALKPTQTTSPTETQPQETEAPTETSTEAMSVLVNGMRPEFKEAMDAYEAFYKEYCDLLKKYTENPTDFSILGKYANMLTKIDEVDKAFQKWDESDMNSEELKYYLDVNNRVLKMLVDVAG